MALSTASFNIDKLKNFADWKLLLFLILFLDVKIAVKVAAILLIYLLQFNFKFGFRLKDSRLPLFYLAAIGIAVLNWIIGNNHGINYTLVTLIGIGFWLLCILAMHQVKLSVDSHDADTLHRTLIIFFILNAMISLINIGAIIYETGYLNPYTYQGQYQKYFIGTGDYIKGLTFDTSITNAVLNAFGVIYFLSKKNARMLLICMAIMLLTGSNFINLLVLVTALLIFIFKSSRDQKSLIAVCMMMLAIFLIKISPQNYIYAHEVIKNNFFPQPIVEKVSQKPLPYITLRPDNTLTPSELKEKKARMYLDSIYVVTHPKHVAHKEYPIITASGRIITPGIDINSQPYQHVADTTPYQRELLSFISEHKAMLPMAGRDNYKARLPGKIIGSMQTINFLLKHPLKLLVGEGVGNFSSKLAFRVSGLGFAGGYPQQYNYINPDFLANHLDVYLDFFSRNSDEHSLTNNTGSVYDQLLAEYGILGVLCFAIGYLGYFAKHYRKLTYGLPLLLMLLAMFTIDYWFEQLSILLFFELLLLLNIKENANKPSPSYAN